MINFGDSDHNIIGLVRLTKEPKNLSHTIRKRSFKYFDSEQFLHDVSEVIWTDVLCCNDLDEAVALFTDKFRCILNFHAPWIVYQERKSFKPWISKNTLELMKQRDSYKTLAIECAHSNKSDIATFEEQEAWAKYKRLRNLVNNSKKNDEYKFKSEKIEDSMENVQRTWKSIKTFMNWKSSGSPNKIVKDNILYSKSVDVANIMNQFFIEKIDKLRKKAENLPPNLEHCSKAMQGKNCHLSLKYVSKQKVLKILKNLKPSRCPSIDGLDSFTLKLAAEHVLPCVHHIITLSLMQRKFPCDLKLAKVIPIHKKQSPMEQQNYRPVSILSPLSKVIERVIYEQIYDYFSKNRIFHPNLMGFRKNRSTMTALVQMYDRWICGANNSMINGVVLLDLSAAFDLVDSNILLNKLKVYGMNEDFIDWVSSYMTNRKQAVWVNHVYSDLLNVRVGVPQGSILGPLLFIVFANDLPYSVTCELDSYADDSTLTSTKETIAQLNTAVNENCSFVSKWMQDNKLCLNIDKTHLLVIGTSQRLKRLNIAENLDMQMGSFPLVQSNSEKLLGVTVQADLKWTKHIDELKSKLQVRLHGLQTVRYIVNSMQIRKKVEEGVFMSVLVYCIPVWGGCGKTHVADLQVLQNVAAQHVLRLPRMSSRHKMYDELDWLTVSQLIFYHTMMLVYRIRKSGEPEYLAEKLRNENFRGNVIAPITRLTIVKNSFVFRGAHGWSSLPARLRSLDKIEAFKKGLRKYTMDKIPRFVNSD